MEGETTVQKTNFFTRWGSKIFIGFTFLLPLFFIPSPIVNFQFGKAFFMFFVVFVLAIVFLMGVLKEGRVGIPKSLTLFGAFVVLLAYVVSGLFSSFPALSLLGQGFEIDTAIFMLVGCTLALMVPVVFKQKTALFNIYIALLASFMVAVLFNVVRFFAPTFLSFGIFNNSVSNLVGTWNDLGVFAGFITLLSLISLSVLEARGFWRTALYIGLILGVAFLAIVNFNVVWWVMAAFSLVFFLYSVSYAKHRGGALSMPTRMRQVSWTPIFVLIVSVVFIISGTTIGESIARMLNIAQLEARPSLSTTASIARNALSENPIVGIGPNQFTNEWLRNKPLEVNESLFWNVDFNAGVGNILTSFITLGGLGILAWVIFFVLFLFEGIRAIRKLHGDAFAHYLAFSSFVGALYFWIIAIAYTPTHAMYGLAFLFTGVFIATLLLERVIEEKLFDFSDHPGKSFLGSLVTIVLVIGAATCLYLSLERFVSFAVFNRAIIAYGQNRDINLVETRVKNALLFDRNDTFFRTLSEIYLTRLGEVVNKPQPASTAELEALQNDFRNYFTSAVASANEAVKENNQNYQNYIELARVYESVVPLKIQGAYDEAKKAYVQAQTLNPKNPALPLAVARLESANGDNKKARDEITKALQLKNNYTDAVFLLAQIEVADGNTKKAIEAVSAGTLLSPTNPVLFFQLGFLHYNDRSWNEAVKALEQAIRIEPQYANAKYFLGLSYDRLGRDADAIRMFEDLNSTNPDNQEVTFILKNLKAGKSPFAQAEAPIDDKPEKRKNPPVEEKKTSERE